MVPICAAALEHCCPICIGIERGARSEQAGPTCCAARFVLPRWVQPRVMTHEI